MSEQVKMFFETDFYKFLRKNKLEWIVGNKKY